jgi:hypothetical protein
VINPSQAHDFAKALLKRTKTAASDAQTLAQLAALLQPQRWTPPPAIYTELQQRLVQRDSLLARRQQVRNQLHALEQRPVGIAAVRQRMAALLETLTAPIKEVAKAITPLLAQDEAWAKAAALLQTITGVGLVTAAWLVTSTLNFSICPTPEAAAAYAGLVSYVRKSGTRVRGKEAITRSGNKRLRRTRSLPGHAGGHPVDPPEQGVLHPVARPRQASQSGPLCGSAHTLARGLGRGHQRPALRSHLPAGAPHLARQRRVASPRSSRASAPPAARLRGGALVRAAPLGVSRW